MIVFIFVSFGIDVRLNVIDGIDKLTNIGILKVVWIIRVGSFGVISVAWIVKLIEGLSNCKTPIWIKLPFGKS